MEMVLRIYVSGHWLNLKQLLVRVALDYILMRGLVILLIILIFGGDLTNDCDKGYFNRITKYEYARQK